MTDETKQIEDLTAQNAELTEALAQLSDTHNEIAARIRGVGEKLVASGIGEITSDADGVDFMDQLIVKYKEMESERDTAKSALAEITAKNDAAALKEAGKAKATPQPRGENGRALGPLKPKKDEKPLTGGDLLAAIAAAETVEVAFSDGKREIKSLPAHAIQGDAWYLAANGVRLRVDKLQVYGPNRGEPDLKLAGYALLLDGEQVAYAARGDVLVLTAGSTNELKDDVIF